MHLVSEWVSNFSLLNPLQGGSLALQGGEEVSSSNRTKQEKFKY